MLNAAFPISSGGPSSLRPGRRPVARRRRNVAKTIGIDLGDKTSRYCVLNEQGEVLAEVGWCRRLDQVDLWLQRGGW